MQNPYSEIFRAPGAKGFAAAGFMARLPIAMAPIGIVAMLSQTRGEYWLAGAVSATFALANAFAGAADITTGGSPWPDTDRGAHHHHLGARLRGPDRGGQSGLAGLDAVRVGAAGGGHAQHAGNGARALDRDFPRAAAR